jgi:L-ascorbate metabolism protein UlaG (beta-lactamase superfamily)
MLSQGETMSAVKTTRITWLGHATVLVQTAQGTNLLIDPFIAQNPKYPRDFQLPAKIDYILLTHGHGDHTRDTVPVAAKHGSTVVAINELADYMTGRGVASTIGMNLGGTVQLGEVAATMVEARHSAAVEDEQGSHEGGVAAGYVLTVANGPVLYHAGDTTVFGEHEADSQALSPHGGNAAYWRAFHDGAEGSRAGCGVSGAGSGSSAALRHVSAAEGHAGRTGGAGGWQCECGAVASRRRVSGLRLSRF